MPATIYFVRHAQGYHNLPQVPGGPNPSLLADPDLTELGKEQCAELSEKFPFHYKITHLVASPLRRTLYTCLLSFGPVLKQGRVQKVTALPELQEIGAIPSDTGSDPAVLAKEFGNEKVDLGLVKDDWTNKGPGSPFAPELEKLDARARAARIWLRKLASEVEGDEAHIVVVTHGAILHFLTEDWDGTSINNSTGWQNTEWRSYEFADSSGQDSQASLKETKESRERRRGTAIPLTETEQRELKAVLWRGVKEE
ncbi:hypothetical protein MCOR25_006285 [Pyricularia grisea]|uniref:Phosphoglycerate mutase-like protein n=1 Tax=Pyricularia grisea TaxID=148305 RepID=A0A6P8BJI4_PYRGI|nr:uncharacterized protein PgNI_01354 [Pyricularia grisea]KAI6362213.1 hypothetical protein MCOR25_006285 [Pyricularia grisea]TLD16948.1 hypothetical protein PgNI_01354 [Pyricularia grisea]